MKFRRVRIKRTSHTEHARGHSAPPPYPINRGQSTLPRPAFGAPVFSVEYRRGWQGLRSHMTLREWVSSTFGWTYWYCSVDQTGAWENYDGAAAAAQRCYEWLELQVRDPHEESYYWAPNQQLDLYS